MPTVAYFTHYCSQLKVHSKFANFDSSSHLIVVTCSKLHVYLYTHALLEKCFDLIEHERVNGADEEGYCTTSDVGRQQS